ncbi:GNAT family N-acetyltransferase [Aeromicrobium sp.]|uniref:GNAT family N-acetyltransferase n=1 Tax=Aeromicrobium sp. TaxID=1871063 RepID=UPI003D6B47B4
MDDQHIYRGACDDESITPPIFLQPWWLDAACGPNAWDVSLAVKADGVHAALPYFQRRARGLRLLTQPALTPYLGPWILETGAERNAEYSRQNELMSALIDGLPRRLNYVQKWSPTITNWLPFYWRGFEQTTRYTYMLDDLSDEERLWRGLTGSTRREIRKAESRHQMTASADATLDELLSLNVMTFARQGLDQPYSTEYVERLDAACQKHDCRRIIIARDSQGRPHAGVYVVWDRDSAYYLMGAGDPDLRSSGAASLCMWEAIRSASTVSKSFNFEGSMIEPIERFFRGFGARQTPYFQVSRFSSKAIRTAAVLSGRM